MWKHPDGREIHPLEYELEPPTGASSEHLIVHLKPDGSAEHPKVFALPPNQVIVTTKPGQVIHAHGQVRKILRVRPYQWVEGDRSRSVCSPPPAVEPTKVIACGSRDYADREAIQRELVKLPANAILVHSAARGADTIAGELAAAMGMQVVACPADWKRHGKGAGPKRNQQMLDDHKPALAIAFPLGESPGTRDMVRRSEAAGVKVIVIEKIESGG